MGTAGLGMFSEVMQRGDAFIIRCVSPAETAVVENVIGRGAGGRELTWQKVGEMGKEKRYRDRHR